MKKRKIDKDMMDEEFVPKAFQKDKKQNRSNKKIQKRKSKNRGKSSIEQEVEVPKKSLWKRLKIFICICLMLVILFKGILIAISTNTWKKLSKDMLLNKNSVVLDTDNKVIAELGSERKKEYISYDKIPDNLTHAYVAIEDERFYKHHGVDIKRTSSAIFSYIIHFGSSSFGGSTITQQLVKNLTGNSTDSISRKVGEWWKAWQLETYLNKDEVLEGYLNVIYVGPNIYGVQAGAKYYFNKPVEDLSLEECAFLAGINHSPNSYNPFGEDKKIDKINKRTKLVLNKMLELKYINKEEYDQANSKIDNGLTFKNGKIESGDGVYSYHTDALISEVSKDISKKYNISDTFANNYLYMAGLNIYSTQDSKVQSKVNDEFEKSKYRLKSNNSDTHSQAAMVIIDHKTGYVTACVGGLGKKNEARTLNRATQSVRQTGSAIKPISVLVPAIDKRIITASTVLNDKKREFENEFMPEDYSNELGEVTVRRAVESSQNIPFVEIMEKLKPSKSINYLKKMGVTTLTEKDNNLVLALGGLEKGISPLEMAGAYATIANDGIYIEPTFYKKIDNSSKDIIITSKQKKRRVFSKEVAFIVKELLIQPVKGLNGTATYCSISDMDVAAKTGTTDENYDRWLCGFTPYYTAVTWFGYDKNESINYYGKNPAGLIWANVMNNVHMGLKKAKFEKPNNVKAIKICADTGLKANTSCSNVYEEYYLWFTEPESCTKHLGNNKNNTNYKNNDVNKDAENKINNVIDTRTTLEEEEKVYNSIVQNNTVTNKNTNNTNTNNKATNSSSSNSNTVNNNSSNNTISTNTITNKTNTSSSNVSFSNTVINNSTEE